LASWLLDGPDRLRLLRYAEELEGQAVRLEATGADALAMIASSLNTHSQQQVQQQQATEPEPKPHMPETKT
jgi:hypothetical protein